MIMHWWLETLIYITSSNSVDINRFRSHTEKNIPKIEKWVIRLVSRCEDSLLWYVILKCDILILFFCDNFLKKLLKHFVYFSHTIAIQMTNNRPVYILPLIKYNAYWPFIGHFYCMPSIFIRYYKLLQIFGDMFTMIRNFEMW